MTLLRWDVLKQGQLLVPLAFMVLVGAAATQEEEFKSNGEGLHIIGLVRDFPRSEQAFLHSACRLKYPNVQVLRGWCHRPTTGCEEDPRLEERLMKLPEDDLVIVASLGEEFVYIVRRYEEARQQLLDSTHSLIVAEVPQMGHKTETLKDRREKEKMETKESKDGREGMKEEAVTVESSMLEASSDTTLGNEGKTKEDENTKGTEGKKIEKTKTIPTDKPENDHGRYTEDEDEVKTSTQYEANEKNNRIEETIESTEEGAGILIRRALKGGAVLGRVRSLLQVLRGQITPGNVTQDPSAQYVLFGNRQKGGLSLSLPLRAVYTPEEGKGGDKTHPIMVYSLDEMLDFHNMIELAGDGVGACPYAQEATPTPDDERPRVLMAVLLGRSWAPFLEEVFSGLALQDYPKDRMDVWLQTKSGEQEEEVSSFVDGHKGEYASLAVLEDQVPDMQMLRSRCVEVDCSFLVIIEPQALLEDPSTLSSLIEANKSVVSPLLKQKQQVNFVYSEDLNSPWNQLIRDRSFRATLRVQEVRSFRVIRREALDDLLQGKPVEQFINTAVPPGVLLDPRGFKKGKRHPDLWGITYNRRIWTRRYIHPDLLKIIWKKMDAEEVGPYLYYVPFFSERFCRELVQEMETFGKWQNKDKDDREEAHQYTSTNINLSQIGYSREYHLVINSLNKELLATLYGGYRGLGHASLSFVLKYLASTDYNTFKYHLDGATYTFNIALNNEFTGGGLQFKLGNKHFDEEREIFLPHNRTGWAVVQPNRPMHLHQGVGLDSGLRYALIAIVDTDDASCKGGPKWVI
ncbi:procollagen-lysine,2-oxoglutarate 5-dioxygenase 1-like [Panulirus ornatus]|uniref:procollagen-lysine,2-oxoglutarate 5-dioxygenase 1-like n=1 Tax=Panulirus ornatus TaxID=150431 RepID=UPI003A848C58